jgi:hypothetical protein
VVEWQQAWRFYPRLSLFSVLLVTDWQEKEKKHIWLMSWKDGSIACTSSSNALGLEQYNLAQLSYAKVIYFQTVLLFLFYFETSI